MKKLLIAAMFSVAFMGVSSASVLEESVVTVKKESSFLVATNYIVVVVVKTTYGTEIEIQGKACALRHIEHNGGEIVGYRSVPAYGPTPFKCADLPDDDNVRPPGSGGGSSGGGGGVGGPPKHDFKKYDPNDDYKF
ncbi:hypothetical protein LNQ81_13370 [Myroides sp. M-43]|uniref:hypothetical protein n=1 Tax=Myroides oncorhynchi TaxID=2893756 RepID=UPI001E40D3D3|nr:hypothetical protein [Myroides oncorhynchi]MCC9043662.1 hypothetical protein [Myroides oncorhynchi]